MNLDSYVASLRSNKQCVKCNKKCLKLAGLKCHVRYCFKHVTDFSPYMDFNRTVASNSNSNINNNDDTVTRNINLVALNVNDYGDECLSNNPFINLDTDLFNVDIGLYHCKEIKWLNYIKRDASKLSGHPLIMHLNINSLLNKFCNISNNCSKHL